MVFVTQEFSFGEGRQNGDLCFADVPVSPLICQLLSLSIRTLVIS